MLELLNIPTPNWPTSMPGAYVLLAVAHVLDVASTCRALALGAREANPLARWAMVQAQRWGAHPGVGLVLIKTVTTALLWQVGAGMGVVLITAMGTVLVALWNWRLAQRLAAQSGGQP